MFQKLYKHLEEINAAARQQQASLEEINAATREQQASLSHSESWSGKISEQLEALNGSLLAIRRQRSLRFLGIVNLAVAIMSITMIAILSIYSLHLSGATQKALDRAAESSRASRIVFTQYQNITEKQQELESKVARLDTLAQRQAQAILELKKLNITAVRTFVQIRRDLETRDLEQK